MTKALGGEAQVSLTQVGRKESRWGEEEDDADEDEDEDGDDVNGDDGDDGNNVKSSCRS